MYYPMQLTENFSLEELCDSNTAHAKGFDEQFNPSFGVVKNLTSLAENILQPLRNIYAKPITVNCAYRCARLNKEVGGVSTSQHLEGKAADITAGSKEENKKIFDLAQKMNLPFDQLIDEKNYSWIHISYDDTRNRKQILHLC